MEKLELLKNDAARALETLREILDEPRSVIVRDAAIQRFEYTFEVAWKLAKEYLRVHEGNVCASPKACFKSCFKVKLIDEEATLVALEMTDDRNRTVHTYHEGVAEAIFQRLPGYRDFITILLDAIKEQEAKGTVLRS